ncbi:YeiH family putative sulfate export transporter [Pigmentiphaga aceris]|uniref:YeiH family putative sulfate export transporter n=2 Tax=Pigmentiphaga aceris TaxID=1940612 RepID=A0A5C0B5G1_9BURK|nr:YeiH family putative sulfate export transporter [Pigmentiphaga aceris]
MAKMWPGLALSAALACCAMWLGGSGWAQAHGLSALTLAIIMGMVIGNTVFPRIATVSTPGINFSKQRLLRAGVVLYGLRLTMQDVGLVGLTGVAIDALVIGSTFMLSCWLGVRWLGMERKTAMLIGVGSAVCGAAAVMGAEPVVKARAEQVTVAISTVVVFGTLSIFLYPLLFDLNAIWQFIPGGTHGFGVYVGSTIHEVAQVVAAGRAIGPDAAGAAVIAKMVRVMMLAPFLILLSAWLARDEAREGGDASGDGKRKMAIPWFAFGFVAVVLFNSLQVLPAAVVEVLLAIDTALLAMAMAALGLSTHLSAIRKAGMKPLLLAACLFVWLVVGGGVINRVMVLLLG